MHDLATIKRLNRNPSANRQDKPAPQPTREESAFYDFQARRAVLTFEVNTQSPAMDRAPLECE